MEHTNLQNLLFYERALDLICLLSSFVKILFLLDFSSTILSIHARISARQEFDVADMDEERRTDVEVWVG